MRRRASAAAPRAESAAARPRAALACATSALCALVFLAVYGWTNDLAANAGPLPVWRMEWEESIPFVPVMVLPYLSIDLFFVLTPFVVASRRELRLFAARVVTAILAAGVVFTCMPLQLGIERVEVSGAFGSIFELLHGFDAPHNLFPSLHVTLAMILRWTWHRHVRATVGRVTLHTWFALITLSTVLTHQHHVIDVLGGALLGLGVLYVWPTGSIRRSALRVVGVPSPRLTAIYAAGAALACVVCAVSAPAVVNRASILPWVGWGTSAWIGIALAIVAAGYGGLGPRVFRKYAGYLSLPAHVVLAPWLLGLALSRRLYWRRDPQGYADLGDGIYFGRLPDGALLDALQARGVTAFVDLTAEHSVSVAERVGCYVAIPMLDCAPPERRAVLQAVSAVRRLRALGHRVYIHCGLGLGRAAVVAAAVWHERAGGSVEAAAAAIARRRVGVRADSLAGALSRLQECAHPSGCGSRYCTHGELRDRAPSALHRWRAHVGGERAAP